MNNAAADCTVGTSLAFGTYVPISSSSHTTSGRITVSCNPTATLNIALGTGRSNNYSNRHLIKTGSSTPLRYNMFRNFLYSSIWGDGTSGTSVHSGTFTSTPTIVPIYARIPSRQAVEEGAYSDTITIVINF